MRTIKILFGMLLFTFVLLLSSKVNAAGSVSLSSSKSKVTVGDTFTITANLSGASLASYTVRINVDTTKVSYVSGTGNSSFSGGTAISTWTDPAGGSNPKKSGTIASFTFKANSAGTAVFSVGGDYFTPSYDNANPSFSNVSVKIEEKVATTKPPVNTNTTTNTQSNTTNNSTNNTTNKTNTTTNKNVTNSKNTTTTQSSPSNQTTTTTSSNANLKSLRVDNEGLSPSFSSSITSYSLVVALDEKNVDVIAEPEDSKASVNISGNKNLKEGKNTIKIVVTAEDGTTKTYKVNVTRTGSVELANANLENLAIEDVILSPLFDPNITEYSSQIPADFNNPHILAIAQNPKAKVETSGATENLDVGNNTIIIKVTAEDKITTKTYTINLYKSSLEEVNLLSDEVVEAKSNVLLPIILVGIVIISGFLGYWIYRRRKT